MLHFSILLSEGALPRFGGTDGPDLGRYILVCVVLLASIALVAFGFRRLVAGNLRTRAARRSLQVLDVLPLGGRHKLCVVRCYDRTFALGLGEKEVSLVAELDPAAGQEPAEESEPPLAADREAFVRALDDARSALEPKKKRPRRRKSPVGKTLRELLPEEGALG